jgi:hypothetical protein
MQRLQHLPSCCEYPEVRTEELVGRTRHEVRPDAVQIDQAMLGEMDAVKGDDRAQVLGPVGKLGRGRDRPDGVRCQREGKQSGAFGERLLERRKIESGITRVDVDPADGGSCIRRRQRPRSDVRIVVQSSEDHLVAGPERLPERTGEMEEQRGRIRAEDDLIRSDAQEVGGRAPCVGDHGIGLLARGEGAVGVAQASAVVSRDRVDHRIWHLGPAWCVHEDHRATVWARAGERGEPFTDAFDVEHVDRLPQADVTGKPRATLDCGTLATWSHDGRRQLGIARWI